MPANSARTFLALIGLVSLAACAKESTMKPDAVSYFADAHSYARPDEARVNHVALDLTPDFGKSQLQGVARLSITRAAGIDTLILDISKLVITSVTDTKGDTLQYTIGAVQPILGQSLAISLGKTTDTVVIVYHTSPDADAVQWLTPAQTSGKKLPFLFTQGEAIYTRTWIPTQDSPGIRQTYEAAIHVPAGMRAVMSAEEVDNADEKDANGLRVYRYRLDTAIPPYLIALAVGDLSFMATGDKTGVYAEPAVVERAAREFSEVPSMIFAAEKLFGPYRWGRYDILVLPPSFPLGGMENPRLTFATPTVLAGDKSLVSLVAHELAHSWSGNLVTNATWDDFWLNEGFTTYLEGRIMEELRGKPYGDMHRVLGRQDLAAAVTEQGGPTDPRTRLHLDLKGHDPDDATNDIAYEKGAAFLQTVESVVGRPRLDAFLRDYFDHFAFQPMTSDRMVAYLEEKLLTKEEAKTIGVDEWVYQPGVPANMPAISSGLFTAVEKQTDGWKGGGATSALETKQWSTQEWLHFLRALPDTLSGARLAELDKGFKLSGSGNSEIQFAWFVIAIRNHYTPAFAAMEKFLTTQGRRKFVRPLYTQLNATSWGKEMAMTIYTKARPMYHPMTVTSVDPILGWKP